jgi:multicomponent Na+:H+ antiporter subunit D
LTVLAVMPVLVPLATAVLAALVHRHPAAQRAVSGLGIVAFLGCALALVALAATDTPADAAFGGWPAPFGIQFHIDRTGAALVLVPR